MCSLAFEMVQRKAASPTINLKLAKTIDLHYSSIDTSVTTGWYYSILSVNLKLFFLSESLNRIYYMEKK